MGTVTTYKDSTTGRAEPGEGTNGAPHVYKASLDTDENESLGCSDVAFAANTAVSVARTTSDANIGNATAGDYLHKVVVTVSPTTAALTISDGAGTVVCSIAASTAIGTVYEVECTATTSGFVVDSHASGAGTVTCIGIFQA